MKKLISTIGLLFFLHGICTAQVKRVPKNEVSLNPISLFFNSANVTYERLFTNSVHSVGIDFGLFYGEKTDEGRANYFGLGLFNEQIIRPFHRLYFNENHKKLFLETHLNFDKFYRYDFDYSLEVLGSYRKKGFGISFGYKTLSKKNYIFQIKAGVTRDLGNTSLYEEIDSYDETYFYYNTRLTSRLTIGKRF